MPGLHRSVAAVSVIMIILFWGCAAFPESSKGTYSTRVGTGTATDIKVYTPRILNKYHYDIARFEESSDQLYFQTYWNNRSPFEDEEEMGIVDARTRFIITTRSRSRSGMRPGVMNTVRLEVENQVRFRDEDEWKRVDVSDDLQSFVRNIVLELRSEIDTGVRSF